MEREDDLVKQANEGLFSPPPPEAAVESEVVTPEIVEEGSPKSNRYPAPFRSQIGASTVDLTNEVNSTLMQSEYDEWWNFGKKRGFLGIPYTSDEFKGERDKLKDAWYRK